MARVALGIEESCKKLHIDQMMRTRNFKVRNDVVERGSITKSQNLKKGYGQCSKGDSCSISHDTMASGNEGDGQRRKGRSFCPASHLKAKTDGEGQKPSMESGIREESSSDKRRPRRRSGARLGDGLSAVVWSLAESWLP